MWLFDANGSSDLIIENNINYIIGSSFGGMLGYWLSEKHKIPALLFNPALQIEKSIIHFEINHNKSPYKLIILGKKDEIVDPIITSKFLNKNLHDKNYEIINCDELDYTYWPETLYNYNRLFF